MIMSEIIFSFVIPHKNCPHLLKRCIDSIPEREDVQIIVVDDNSDSDKKPIASNYKGVEVCYINSDQSKGGGRARNVGVQKAKGYWILFADADDYYLKDELSSLLNKYSNVKDLDVVYLNALSYVGDSNQLSVNQPRINNIFLRKEKLEEKKFEELIRFETWEPWTRMCRRGMVIENNIQFDEIPRQNDLSFGVKVSVYSHTWRIEESKIYCWVEWPKTISRKKVEWTSFRDLLNIRFNLNTLYKINDLLEAFLEFLIDINH